MAKYVMVAKSGVKDGMQAEFDKWYDEVHIPDVCAVPGVLSGRRFVVHAATPASPPNLAIYEIEADDPMTVLAEIGRRVQSGEMVISPALDSAEAGTTLYKAV